MSKRSIRKMRGHAPGREVTEEEMKRISPECQCLNCVLEALEREDPTVGAAAVKLDQVTDEIGGGR